MLTIENLWTSLRRYKTVETVSSLETTDATPSSMQPLSHDMGPVMGAPEAADAEEYIRSAIDTRPLLGCSARNSSSESGAVYTPRMRRPRTFKSIARERRAQRVIEMVVTTGEDSHVPKVPSVVNIKHLEVSQVEEIHPSPRPHPSLAMSHPMSSEETLTSFDRRSSQEETSSDSAYTFAGDTVGCEGDEPATPVSATTPSRKLSQIGMALESRRSSVSTPPTPAYKPVPFRSPSLMREMSPPPLYMIKAEMEKPQMFERTSSKKPKVTQQHVQRRVKLVEKPTRRQRYGPYPEPKTAQPRQSDERAQRMHPLRKNSTVSESSSSSLDRRSYAQTLQEHRDRMGSRNDQRSESRSEGRGEGKSEESREKDDGSFSDRMGDGQTDEFEPESRRTIRGRSFGPSRFQPIFQS